MINKLTLATIALIAISSINPVQAQSNYNSVRIACYLGNLPPPDNYLTRVRDAGYTHVMAGAGHINTTEWDDGEYSAKDTGIVRNITATFIKCNNFGLKFIPNLPNANRHFKLWKDANNPEITYQICKSNKMDKAVEGDVIDNDFILNLFMDDPSTSEFKTSNVPSYAYNADGLDKTYRSLIADVISEAFKATHLPSTELDYIMLGNDEPCTYDANVGYDYKLLIGKSQEELKWMYENDNNHFGIDKWRIPAAYPRDSHAADSLDSLLSLSTLLIPESTALDSAEMVRLDSLQRLEIARERDSLQNVLNFDRFAYEYSRVLSSANADDTLGYKTRIYNDTIYFYDYHDTAYQHGLRELIAEYYRRRVQDVADFLPDVKCIFYGDLFDPEHIGGYFKTDSVLPMLSNKTVTANGVTIPITEKLIFMPWLYPNTFTHELEGELEDAALRTSTVRLAVRVSAAWAACDVAIPPVGPLSAIANGICKGKAEKYVWEDFTQIDGIDVKINFNATGHKYNITNTMTHFMNSGFPFMFMNSFEKEEVASHTLSQVVKMIEEPAKLTVAQRDSFMLGYAITAFGNPEESKTNHWVDTGSAYNQHFTHNNLEIFSASFNWNGNTDTDLLFGDLTYSNNQNIHFTKPITVTDFFATRKDLFNSYLDAPANSSIRSVNFFDALQFCNELSAREGLEPVYLLSNVTYNSLWDTKKLGTIVTLNDPYDIKGPSIIDAEVSADLSKSGYRLPTVSEILSIASEPGFTRDNNLIEWVWNGIPDSMFHLFSHGSLDTIPLVEARELLIWNGNQYFFIPDTIFRGDPNTGRSFRVVRRNNTLPKLLVYSRDEGLYESNITKPRIYVQNGSSIPLSKFTVHYYFTTNQNKTPVLEQYWVPGSSTSMHQLNDTLYEIQYYFAGPLDTGNAVLPSLDGNVVGVHYSDWSDWDKTKDPSFINSVAFSKNENIVITDSIGAIIHGQLFHTGTAGPGSNPNSGISVFSKDEGYYEGNICKPRIYIQNDSSTPLSFFTVHYYFTVEQNKTPELKTYYIPGSAVSLNQINDSLYEVLYFFTGTLNAGGAIAPDMSGNVIGLHYSDWSDWNKQNDPSFNNSSAFIRNEDIVITDQNGTIIYGRIPE
ncbi:MAG: hypothetical protein GX556_15525 [Fibrobacter sp.]|nr:hypothetical protein [Fibrobacter sp.]